MVVINIISFKSLFIVKVKYGYYIRHIDMVKDFLYCCFDKVIYIR